jgi:hypothetical protein
MIADSDPRTKGFSRPETSSQLPTTSTNDVETYAEGQITENRSSAAVKTFEEGRYPNQ